MLLAPSLLSADFGRLADEARAAVAAGADWLHVDVMDGHFVPNLTIGPLVVEALRTVREETGALLDVHLMIEHPDRYVDAFADAGADVLTIHPEADPHLHRTLQAIRARGVRAGVALNPATPLAAVEEVLPDVDLVLVMTVNPGFGGQAYIPTMTRKVARARAMLDAAGSRAHLEVDGGITPGTLREVARAGATVAVAGSAVFGGTGSVEENISALRSALAMRA